MPHLLYIWQQIPNYRAHKLLQMLYDLHRNGSCLSTVLHGELRMDVTAQKMQLKKPEKERQTTI